MSLRILSVPAAAATISVVVVAPCKSLVVVASTPGITSSRLVFAGVTRIAPGTTSIGIIVGVFSSTPLSTRVLGRLVVVQTGIFVVVTALSAEGATTIIPPLSLVGLRIALTDVVRTFASKVTFLLTLVALTTWATTTFALFLCLMVYLP
jgi:hypothetical protein